MAIERQYQETLPFAWKKDIRGENDRNWLQEIVGNTPPFSDRWTKARIVRLAHELNSEEKIVEVLRSQNGLEEYPYFSKKVDKDYVTDTLNQWKNKKFRQAIGRNFEIYAYKHNPNAFLVISRTSSAFDAKHKLPPTEVFRSLFNVDELAVLIKQNNITRLSLRTHGYATPAERFYTGFCQEINYLNDVARDEHFYIGYSWPSEPPLAILKNWLGWLRGVVKNPDIYFKFALVLIVGSLIVGTSLDLLVRFWNWAFGFQFFSLYPQWIGLVIFAFSLWSLAFWLLREVAYQGDRTRAMYYGIPDLAEFFSRLDRGIEKLNNSPLSEIYSDLQQVSFERSDGIAEREYVNSDRVQFSNSHNDRTNPSPQAETAPLKVNFIGHSMGGFVVLNSLRTLRYQFRYDESKPYQFGEHFQLDKLILASPDIPVELMRQGRNNYARTALNCCHQIYLLSSDRDIVLRYLSTVGNWFTEPSIPMSALRLGNVYLRENSQGNLEPRIRTLFNCQTIKQPKSDLELFDKFNYLDCSEMKVDSQRGGVNDVELSLNKYNGLLIDIGNTIAYLFNNYTKVDLHGGYFQPETPSFKIFHLLLENKLEEEKQIQDKIAEIINRQDTGIRFLPSQKQEEDNKLTSDSLARETTPILSKQNSGVSRQNSA